MGKLEDEYKPKYIQLVEIIKHEILSGKFKGGDKLPSENELKKEYNVSSTTVRKCIDILRNYGLIYREQGVGTFVSERPVERSLQKIFIDKSSGKKNYTGLREICRQIGSKEG